MRKIPISKDQMAQLWFDEFSPTGHCGLCGNGGRIDTIGEVKTPRGEDVGGRFWCICPNGRLMKKQANGAAA